MGFFALNKPFEREKNEKKKATKKIGTDMPKQN